MGSVNYASIKPVFVFDGDVQGANGVCRIILPTCVDGSLRTFKSSRCWTTEKLLKADAAFEACLALHKAGLLNDHMLPIKDLSKEESTMYQVVEKRPNVVAVNKMFCPWSEVMQASQSSHAYFQCLITVQEGNKVLVKMNLLMARMPSSVQSFELYIDPETTWKVSFETVLPAGTLDLAAAERLTKAMLHCIFRSRIDMDEAILPIFFMPPDEPDESWFLQEAKAIDTLLLSSPALDTSVGLVREVSGKLFIPLGMQEVFSIDEATGTPTRKNMIRVSALPKRYDFLHSDSFGDQVKTVNEIFLDPETCTMDRLPLHYAQFGRLIPSIQHKIQNALLVERLNNTILAPASISSLPLILEAISTPACRENANYQRMEFLGDAIFKYYTVVTIMAQHLNYPEGYLAYTKDLIVSNKSAALVAKEIGLDRFIIREGFTGAKWRPVYLKDILSESVSDQGTCTDELSTKVLADVVEALIAAAYLDGHGTESKVLAMLSILTCSGLRQKITWEPLASLGEKLRSAVPKVDSVPPVAQQLEAITGYTFRLPALAVEALTHPGHVAVASDTLGYSTNYQRLEFLGDAVLDMVVTRFIYSCNKSTPVPRMHLLRTAAVNQDVLGYFALRLGIEIETSELVDNAEASSMESDPNSNHSIKPSKLPHRATRRIFLLQLLRHAPSIQLVKDLSDMQKRCEDLNLELSHALEHGETYPWTLLASLNLGKVASDLIEATIGAIYIDSHGDLGVCEAWIARVGILPWLRRAMEEDVKVWHPKEELGVLADQKKVSYQVKEDPEKGSVCTLFVGDAEICQAHGVSRKIAEMRAAEIAVEMLSPSRKGGAGGVPYTPAVANELSSEVDDMVIC